MHDGWEQLRRGLVDALGAEHVLAGEAGSHRQEGEDQQDAGRDGHAGIEFHSEAWWSSQRRRGGNRPRGRKKSTRVMTT